jgi:D-alanine-D-alanine ligase
VPRSREVWVLAGGLSHERDVSLRSGKRAVEALSDVGVKASLHDSDTALIDSLTTNRPDVVLPMLHGASGEDGSIREIFDAMGIPYVGAPPVACRAVFDKPTAKSLVADHGLATPQSLILPRSTCRELGARPLMSTVLEHLGLPLVVKPTRGGSALGVTMVHKPAELADAMVGCFSYSDVALVEQYVGGTEIAVSVIDTGDGPIALPPVEILADGGIYDYQARYTAGATQFFAPARVDVALSARLQETAIAAHCALGLRDLSRTDVIVDTHDGIWFLEANVAPGMTETSLFPQAVGAGKRILGEVLDQLTTLASARRDPRYFS